MANLAITEIKSFIPSKDFDISQRFYQALGFEVASVFSDVAYMRKGHTAFLLQNYYQVEHAENTMMHLLVEDAMGWLEHVKASSVEKDFECKVTELIEQPWGMLEFCLTDPSGVLWRIAQNIR
ncbi:glyoxalase [Vibrio coralliilyticus]|uniref:VOC family protein n=1 Tax=Vibrio TaxID=662 RepID=UPI000502FA43|nr:MULTISPECIES: VOC family protein [Vibrio]KFI11163.1 glyoxalase [Vibrio sp. B183]NOI17940.1 glyoxalase [Vibrio coralliilyticus]